jgi:hypothetical protein
MLCHTSVDVDGYSQILLKIADTLLQILNSVVGISMNALPSVLAKRKASTKSNVKWFQSTRAPPWFFRGVGGDSSIIFTEGSAARTFGYKLTFHLFENI